MGRGLRCGVCGEAFRPVAHSLQEMIIQAGRLLCHAEPCFLYALYLPLPDALQEPSDG